MARYKKPLTPGEIEKIRDEDIDFSDIPELDEGFWKNATLIMPENKQSVHLRVDADVLEWFREQGRGHLTRMNAVLRSYYEAHKRK
ncbi:MAG TPA: BrnA antitoxin family protein [Micavibrio sp.]|jgi:uncharacterized protein (DUF4415 family)